MANSTVASANRVQQWDANFFEEYTAANQFAKYVGTSENSVIQAKEQLGKMPGDRITVSLVRALDGAGVTGTTTLEGNEDSLLNAGHQLTVNMLRNGVRVHKMEEIKTAIDLRNAARSALKTWAMVKLRDSIIDALQSPVVDGKTAYSSATEAQKDAWAVANADRVLYGSGEATSTTGNYSGDHSVDLAKIDTTNDKLTPQAVSKAKRMARTATYPIRPLMVDNDGEWYVMFADYRAFRDLKLNSTIQSAWQYASERGKNNPFYTDGDIVWDGVIIKEVAQIPAIGNVGASSAQVVSSFLCGAQAVGLAWAQRTKSVTETFDYGAEFGVAIEEIRAVEKLMFGSVQHGVVTVYSAGANDLV